MLLFVNTQHQHLGSTHCDAEGSAESTVNRSSTSCKDITGLTNDDVAGVTMDSHLFASTAFKH